MTRPWLLTWILWRRLLHPPAHPLFQRVIEKPVDSRAARFIIGVVPLFSLLACCGVWTLLLSLELPIPIPILIAMVTLSSGYVAVWVIRITVMIAGERERGTYDQLCVLPSGALAASWAMCAASMHQDDTLGWIDLLRKFLNAVLFFILMMVLLITAFRDNAANPPQFMGLFLDMLLLAAVAYGEHVQAIVLGSLVAMLIPTYRGTRVEARLWGVVTFLTLQAVSLLTALLAGLLLPSSWEISAIFLSLLLFYLIREVFIAALWGLLAYQLNTPASELDF